MFEIDVILYLDNFILISGKVDAGVRQALQIALQLDRTGCRWLAAGIVL